jgi:hypothetical protein
MYLSGARGVGAGEQGGHFAVEALQVISPDLERPRFPASLPRSIPAGIQAAWMCPAAADRTNRTGARHDRLTSREDHLYTGEEAPWLNRYPRLAGRIMPRVPRMPPGPAARCRAR